MPESVIEKFEVRHLKILDEKGNADTALLPNLSDSDLKKLFELIILSRQFDQRALQLHAEGRLGTYASILGQEASQIGSAFALEKTDWVFPSFRENAVYITLGFPIWMLFQYWTGDERGMETPDDLNIFPVCVPVGTQPPHAVGAAFAAKVKGHKTAAVTYFGDGGSSKGDFYESMNLAGVYKLPVVFICQNNQWAISVPRERQTAAKTIAQKACACGFEGIQVDGNDIFAVYKATKDALAKAKNGGGPTLIECFTYRMGDHTTADDASRYRPKEDLEKWKLKDPLLRLKLYMEKKGLWTQAYEDEVRKKITELVDNEIKKAESESLPDPKDIINFTYKELTQRQKKELETL
ncbi:MAG: pyruvate dehydrogenase (acetyl-transferring) E1 component subunit alpha [Deltaproteobacteria bacterium RIFCSPLOWO2_12_FULL_43_16]|nr:MAG: pyruvate dehydrogenase (acetyl-transferring) E1 component subunit alpha [Deltaproteobacteria bacterium GWA2_43_19]OGQ61150.1 MAG: pyruvate dehydrogenase (acetyl-transferring) E1 component subunit alpha [Deltaproteobacteria bacterium RIFCSPLOWO2_12_FULL_43_16]HBR17096.1 pyruvate dehydrogenase (acetyl-transferring) E1 component subunit alpha [Deltaproteobacteria bacterium]